MSRKALSQQDPTRTGYSDLYTGGASKVLEDHGVCSKTGVIFNPFGAKPEWVTSNAEKLQNKRSLDEASEALL